MLHGVLTIAAKDLRQRLRDRSAMVLGFVAPLVMVTLMNAAFAGAEQFHATLGVVDSDGGPAGAEIVAALESPDLAEVVTLRTFDGPDEARQAVDDASVDAALILPAGLSAMAGGGPAVAMEVFTSIDAELAGEVAHGIATAFTARLAAIRLVGAVAADLGLPPERLAGLVARAATEDAGATAVDRPAADRPLRAVAYFGPSMAMFFVLFSIGFTARGFFIERRAGTLDRMAAAPIRPEAVLAGKALSVFVYALGSLLTMSTVTALAFGASWGSPLGVGLLCLAMAASVVGLAALVMSVARTERQAEMLSSVVTFALALAGGSFMFVGQSPAIMRRLAVLTPNGWALRGFTDLATGVEVWTAVTAPLAGIAAFTAVVTVISVVTGRGALAR